jgi:endoribonuclease Dicer
MPSKKLAKRAVALQACILLHKMGELNENLLPKECKDSPLDHPELYPLYVEVKAGDIPQPGSNKRKRHYCKEVSLLPP